MKKLSLYVFLGLLWCNVSLAGAKILKLKCRFNDTSKYEQIFMIDWNNSKITWASTVDVAEYKIVKKEKYGSEIEDMFNAYKVDDGDIRKSDNTESVDSHSYQFSLTLMYVNLFDKSAEVGFAQAFRLSIYEDENELILMPEKKGAYTSKGYTGVIYNLNCLYM